MKGSCMKKALFFAAAFCLAVSGAEAAKRKKVIGCGWGFNTATTDDFLAHAKEFGETGLDGVLV